MSVRVALTSFWRHGIPPKPCGSETAHDGGVSADINVGRAGLIASKLAPTGFSGAHKCLSHHKTKVGASLLAMAECQPVSMLDVPASSRASSLPQVSVTPTNACHTTKQRWERARSRWRSVSQYQCWMCRPYREQVRSHRTRWLASRSAGLRQTRLLLRVMDLTQVDRHQQRLLVDLPIDLASIG